MSDIETGAAGATAGGPGPARRTDRGKQMVGRAGHALKAEAQSFASVAQDRVRAQAQKGTQAATKTLGDFANAVRRAGDELAEADQSPASRLVRQAADGLETLTRNLEGKEPGDLLNAVRDFGRRNPAAFVGGAVLVGLALGRFVRASESTDSDIPPLTETDLALAEERAFDGPAETGLAPGGLVAPLADNLGLDDGTSGIGETDATTFPHTGGR